MSDLVNAASTSTRRLKAALTLIAAIAFAASPLLSPGFSGYDPAQYPTPVADPPIQPAGWAFAIWSVIYLWLIASAGFGLLRRDRHPAWDAVRWPLIVSLAVGAVWLPVAQASPLWATALIVVMLVPALIAADRAPAADPWWLAAPLGLYAGWLTAATWVSVALIVMGWTGADPVGVSWAALVLALATAAIFVPRLAVTYAVAVVWALAGVTAANLDRPALATGAALGALALAAWRWRRAGRSPGPRH